MQTFSLSATISGLNSPGLVLLVNNATTVSVADGATTQSLAIPLLSGASYTVTVSTQPTGQTCAVAGGSGTIGSVSAANVVVTCSDQSYALGGSIRGSSSSGLILANDGVTLAVSSGGTSFTMPTPVAYTSGAAIAGVSNTTLLYSFGSSKFGDGANPLAGLIQGSDGNFYGTTEFGGVNWGTVFEITPSGAETVLYSFTGGSDDATSPQAGLIEDSDGNFYGTTVSGGAGAYGSVFEITPSGAEAVLHAFTGGRTFSVPILGGNAPVRHFPAGSSTDGATPRAGLIQGSDGNFYGTTYMGGTKNDGTAFEITPSGTETVLHSFTGGSTDGASPQAGLIQAKDGNFYGTTQLGGTSGNGTVFEITPSGTETVLHSFAGGRTDGANPLAGLIRGSDGSLYGTTADGGTSGDGTVFEITPSGTETVLYSFAGGRTDGADPLAGLIQGSDGSFYGTTWGRGANNAGTVFEITPSGTETVLHSFAGGGSDGAEPEAGLIQGSDGNLYGTTFEGGADNEGTVFKVTLR